MLFHYDDLDLYYGRAKKKAAELKSARLYVYIT